MRSARPVVTLISALTADDSPAADRVPSEPPLGVLSLAAVLNARDLHTDVIDLNLLWARSRRSPANLFRNAVSAVRASQPCLLGFSTICSSYPLTLRLAKTLKEQFPHTPIVLGGPQASLVDVATLTAFPFIDFVLRGEAEETLPTFVHSLLNGKLSEPQPGLTFKTGSRPSRNPDAAPILDLDSLPLPAFDGYPGVSQWPYLPLEIGRGCPFSCRFCSTSDFFRHRYRLKSMHQILRQMTFLKERWGRFAFNLIHDMVTVDRRRVVDFCRGLIALGTPYTWTCSARTDSVDNQLLTLMRKAGCAGIFFGIETGSRRLQPIIGKHLDLRQARTVLRRCDFLQIETTASLIIGYPDETADDLNATLSFFRDTVRLSRADGQLHLLAPLPNTSLETEYRSRLILDDAFDEIAEVAAGQRGLERLWVQTHPEIFSSFYTFPHLLKASRLAAIREFFVALQQRCRGLLLALLDSVSKPLELFDRWRHGRNGQHNTAEYYRGVKFVEDFLTFVKDTYVGRGSVAVDVMWRFYRNLRSGETNVDVESQSPRKEGSEKRGRDNYRLSPDVRIVSVRGDVVTVLNCLQKGTKPGLDCADRKTTISARKVRTGRFAITKLPSLTAMILAGLPASSEELVWKLSTKGVIWEGRKPAQFLSDALRFLECDGLVTSTAVPTFSPGSIHPRCASPG